MPNSTMKSKRSLEMSWTWQTRFDTLRKSGKLFQFSLSSALLILGVIASLSILSIAIISGTAPALLGTVGTYLAALGAFKLGALAFVALSAALTVSGISLAYNLRILSKQNKSVAASMAALAAGVSASTAVPAAISAAVAAASAAVAVAAAPAPAPASASSWFFGSRRPAAAAVPAAAAAGEEEKKEDMLVSGGLTSSLTN